MAVDTRNRSIEGIILRSRDYREQDKLLTVVSAEYGPEPVIARGAQKPGGSLRSVAQVYSRAQLLLTPPKGGVSFLQEGVPEESYLALDAGLERFAYAAYCGELLLLAWPQGKPSTRLYSLLMIVLTLLKLDDDPARAARFLELHLLQELGLLPPLDGCNACGCSKGSAAYVLSPQQGALLCAACAMGEAAPPLSAGALRSMELLLTLPLAKLPSLRLSPAISAEIERCLAYYLNYHLDGAERARRSLRSLLAE